MSGAIDSVDLIDIDLDATLEDELSWLYVSPNSKYSGAVSPSSSHPTNLHQWMREPLDTPQRGAKRAVHSLTFQLDDLSKGTPPKENREADKPQVLTENGHHREADDSMVEGVNMDHQPTNDSHGYGGSPNLRSRRGPSPLAESHNHLNSGGHGSPTVSHSTPIIKRSMVSNESPLAASGSATFTRPKGRKPRAPATAPAYQQPEENVAAGDGTGDAVDSPRSPDYYGQSASENGGQREGAPAISNGVTEEHLSEADSKGTRDVLAVHQSFDSSTFTRPSKRPQPLKATASTTDQKGRAAGRHLGVPTAAGSTGKGWKSVENLQDGGGTAASGDKPPDLKDIQALARLQEQSLRESFNNVRRASPSVLEQQQNMREQEDGSGDVFTVHHHQYKNKAPASKSGLSPRQPGGGRTIPKPKSALPAPKRSGIPSPRQRP